LIVSPKNRRLQKIKKHTTLIISILFFAIVYFGNEQKEVVIDESQQAIVSSVLNERIKKTDKTLEEINSGLEDGSLQEIFSRQYHRYSMLFKEEHIALFGYLNGSLVTWTENYIPYHTTLKSTPENKIIQLKNGWYAQRAVKGVNTCVVGLILIKHEYPYKNRHLVSEFLPEYEYPAGEIVSIKDSVLVNGESHPVLTILPEKLKEQATSSWVVALSILAILFAFYYFYQEIKRLEKSKGKFLSTIVFSGVLIVVRYIMIMLAIPELWQHTTLFNPTLYAYNSFFPSLGDLLLNVLVFFGISYFWYSRFKEELRSARVAIIFLVIVIITYSHAINLLVIGLIEDSNINFNIINAFEINSYSILGLLIIGGLFYSFLLIVSLTVKLLYNSAFSIKIVLIVLIAVLTTVGSLTESSFAEVAWPIITVLIVSLEKPTLKTSFRFGTLVFLLLSFSFFGAQIITQHTAIKEHENRKILAEKLSANRDFISEFLFSKIENKLMQDTTVKAAFSDKDVKNTVNIYLKETYFNKDWDKYNVRAHFFNASNHLIDSTSESITYAEFSAIIQSSSVLTDVSSYLFFIKNNESQFSYIAKLPIFKDNLSLGLLVLTVQSKLIPQNTGFPDLLLDESAKLQKGLSGYAYARYVNNKLMYQQGNYWYSNTADNYLDSSKNNDTYNHLVYPTENDVLLVISEPVPNFLTKTTVFSYLLVLFSLMLIVAMVFREFPRGFSRFSFSLKNKIQTVLISAIVVTLLIFSFGTYYNNTIQYHDKNIRLLHEKMSSVLIELSHKQQKVGDAYMSYIPKFSTVFFSDINLFDLNGQLLVSSRPEIYDEGLISTRMNPEAYRKLVLENQSEYIHEDQIGNMRFLSAYVPFRDNNNEVKAYLNLPYFAKQGEFEKETSDFLVAIINIFVVLLALSILAALFVSNRITKPLLTIQQSLANVSLDKINMPIEINSTDEIGSLVHEYNKMVSELQTNAEVLAKSERESAWRDMAKQVAHEIKNPLTPMKLSVQHLQRSLSVDDPEWKERLSRFSATLIEQIDTLSQIANEFSNFAKTPKANTEIIDLKKVIEASIELFRETENITIQFETPLETIEIHADRSHMTRVFNNLIKNAIQAIPSDRKGVIKLSIEEQDKNFLVAVADNGVGIVAEEVSQIFTPNFTTKSSGMGIGLAMVKSMVEQAQGEVWFETEAGVGTTFFVKLPVN